MSKSKAYNPLLKSVVDSERVNSVSEGAALLYFLLIAATDDYAHYWGSPRMVLAKLFALRWERGEIAEE